MAYIMLQYDRPADVRNWNEYNRRASGWIDRLLKIPGAISFMGIALLMAAVPIRSRCLSSEPSRRRNGHPRHTS
jgi:hypothetical protein